MPLAGRKFKTCLAKGTETEICLEMAAGLGGLRSVDEPLYVLAEAPVLTEAIHKVFSWLAEYKGIRQKADELTEKNVPVRWLLIDDGWLSAQDELLYDLAPDKKKFPDGQSAVPYYFENSLPVCEAARGMHEALECGASYMDGAVINCMGMAMENILARPSSAVSGPWGPDRRGGGIAVYNLTGQRQSFVFEPADIPELEMADEYWIFDYFEKKVFLWKGMGGTGARWKERASPGLLCFQKGKQVPVWDCWTSMQGLPQ